LLKGACGKSLASFPQGTMTSSITEISPIVLILASARLYSIRICPAQIWHEHYFSAQVLINSSSLTAPSVQLVN